MPVVHMLMYAGYGQTIQASLAKLIILSPSDISCCGQKCSHSWFNSLLCIHLSSLSNHLFTFLVDLLFLQDTLHIFLFSFLLFNSAFFFCLMCCVGNADGMGNARKHELYKACAVLKVIKNLEKTKFDLRSANYNLEPELSILLCVKSNIHYYIKHMKDCISKLWFVHWKTLRKAVKEV